MECVKSADAVIYVEVCMLRRRISSFLALVSLAMFGIILAPAQEPDVQPTQEEDQAKPHPIKKLGNGLVSIGNILVDVNKKEVTVPGRMQKDQTMEFLATKKGGAKSYESVMELDTNAVSFNLALIMIGLEKKNAVIPTKHFDSQQITGDPVEIWVEWKIKDAAQKMKAEEMLFDLQTKAIPKMGQWIYTGSTVLPDGQFLAELDGVLIGFVHSPASIIENATGSGINAYGSIKLNPSLKIPPDTPLKLTVKALPKQKLPD